MEIKDLISQVEAKIQELNRQIQEGCAEMEMLQIEEKCRELSNEITRLLLEYILNRIADEINRSGPLCQGMKLVSYRDRKLKTPFGEVGVRRKYYWDRKRKKGLAPFDQQMGIQGKNL